MSARLFIQGVEYTEVTKGLENLKVSYKRGDSALMNVSITSPLSLTEKGFRILHDTFLKDPCEGKKLSLAAEIITDCCGVPLSYKFKIDYKSISTSEQDCDATITLSFNNPLQGTYEFLRDTIYFKNDFEDAFDVPKVRYSIQRDNFLLFTYLMGFIFHFLVLLEALEAVVNGLISAVISVINFLSNIGFDLPNLDADAFKVDYPSLDNYLAFLSGAGNYHFAPKFKDVFDHNLNQANQNGGILLELDSPLFEEDSIYRNLAFLQGFHKGNSCQNLSRRFDKRAAYNRTATQLATELADVFEMEFVITPNNKFIIDTTEGLTNKAPELMHANQLFDNGAAEEAPEFEFIDKFYKQSFIEYSEDSADEQGNLLLRSDYTDVVDWEGGFTGAERKKKTLPFGAARFMFDKETADKSGFWDDDLLIDNLRKGKVLWMDLSGIISSFDSVACLPRHRDLILKSHVCQYPKLLVLEDNTEINDAKVVRIQDSEAGNNVFWNYNYPMKLDYEAEHDELMKFSYERDDPDHPLNRYVKMKPFKFSLNREMMEMIRDFGVFVAIRTVYGLALPKEISIDHGNCTATVTECVFKCKA